MSRTGASILLVSLFIATWCLPGCGGDDWMNAEVDVAFNMQDGSTHRLKAKGIFVHGDITDGWFIQVLPDKAGYSFDIFFNPDDLTEPGNYDFAESDAVSIEVGWPDSEGDTDYASQESGVVQIDSLGHYKGDTLSGSFDQIILDAWDEDAPNPCLYLSDGRFKATNEGSDIFLQ